MNQHDRKYIYLPFDIFPPTLVEEEPKGMPFDISIPETPDYIEPAHPDLGIEIIF